jgi:glycosyltransferase involved in cell wall biosynthesis
MRWAFGDDWKGCGRKPSTNPMRPLLSVVFISYRRVDLLARAYASFLRVNTYQPVELIVADDGSPPEDQKKIKDMKFDRYVLGSRNRGLGANNNAGLLAARGKYILMLQDDWETTAAAADYLERAVDVLEADPEIGMVRFYGDTDLCPLLRREVGGTPYWVCDHKSSEYRSRKLLYRHIYGDTPHMRRSTLNEREEIGLYPEGLAMEETEESYALRFDQQEKYYIAFLYEKLQPLFLHLGDERSHRIGKMRYRLDQVLISLAACLRLRRGNPLYEMGKSVWFSLKKSLIRARLLR